MRFLLLRSVGALVVLLTMSGPAGAALIVTAVESGGDVVFTTAPGGSLNLTGMSFSSGAAVSRAQIRPSFADFVMGSGPPSINYDNYSGAYSGPTAFGTGGSTFADTGSGGLFGVLPTAGQLWVPSGYASGAPLTGTSTYAGETFASLGVTPGNYVWTFPNDTLTLNIVATIPTPAAVWLFGSALGLLGWMRRSRS